ncbi:cobyrinate a,c-diamide synthase [Halanaerobium hydrogeniformans]|uniref:Cobyrinate a,c-diamide synthase n=1 Tax=Halanaerobium hydrogeniformans TaxID=656519 RepID=E4RK36_HALHG|nr:cobyrinate a,c-diamide synthase [Halanaerobium hydrogeniformans]ADQ15606.1 cobyrinic acid a,c-diamide synthase [Halanaerobium hydrogeniformans]
MNRNRLLIAGSRSGVGKTTISLGIMRALKNRGLNVQPFKVGPDYIDPGFHTIMCENNSYNLDSYFLGRKGVKEIFLKKSAEADISIIEGVMGLYDGKGADSVSSSAEIAKILETPVVLVIDAGKLAQSAAAVVYGYKNYDSELNLKGVIINNISSKRHYKLLKEAVEAEKVGVEVLGYLPRNIEIELPERHLGLVPAGESSGVIDYGEKLSSLIEEYIDLERIKLLASSAKNLTLAELKKQNITTVNSDMSFISDDFKNRVLENEIKIGVAYDQAFNFYYQSNLDMLKAAGAEIIYFSPITDKSLVEVDFLYLGGGFPESFLEELSANSAFKKDLLSKVNSGLPLYAECGGLMYLCSSIKNFNGKSYAMTSILPLEVEMEDSLQEMGYREIESISDNILFKKGEKARGHVFHYSKISGPINEQELNYQYKASKGGYSVNDNVLASYLHLHFASNPKIVENILQSAVKYKQKREV